MDAIGIGTGMPLPASSLLSWWLHLSGVHGSVLRLLEETRRFVNLATRCLSRSFGCTHSNVISIQMELLFQVSSLCEKRKRAWVQDEFASSVLSWCQPRFSSLVCVISWRTRLTHRGDLSPRTDKARFDGLGADVEKSMIQQFVECNKSCSRV